MNQYLTVHVLYLAIDSNNYMDDGSCTTSVSQHNNKYLQVSNKKTTHP
jgi:hypothetical protein